MLALLLLLTIGHTNAAKRLEEECAAVSGADIEAAFIHRGACMVFHSDAKTYTDAKYACNDLPHFYGHLGFLLDKQLMSYMASTHSGAYWIGLERFHQSGYTYEQGWHWVFSDKIKFEAPINITYWDFADPEPDDTNCGNYDIDYPDGICDLGCYDPYKYVCQYDKKERHYVSVDQGKLDVSEAALGDSTAHSSIGCAMECSSSAVCMSFAFNPISGHCVLSMRLTAEISHPQTVDAAYQNFDRI